MLSSQLGDFTPTIWRIIGALTVFAIGVFMVKAKSLIIKLIGLVVGTGGAAVGFAVGLPREWDSVNFLVVTIVFVLLAVMIARTAARDDMAAIVVGIVLALLGAVALVAQLTGIVPNGLIGDIVNQGLDAIRRILNLAGSELG